MQPPIKTGQAFLVGSVLPDVPLMALTIWYLFQRYKEENLPSDENPLYGPEFDEYYFHNEWWKLLISLFHAPFLILVYVLLRVLLSRMNCPWGTSIIWLSAGCGIHSLIDILTHVKDGILILFPFDWDYRYSPLRHRFSNIVGYLDSGAG